MKNKFQSLTEKGRWLLATLTLIFTLAIGQMWGANGDVLFSQDFNSATAVSQNLGDAAVDIDKDSENNIFGNTAASQFTSLKAAKISNAKGGLAINAKVSSNSVEYDYSKKFGFRSDDTKASFHLVKKTNFATTAPTALKIEMTMYYQQLSSGSNVTASFAIGDSFNDKEKPANANIHSGFTIKGNGTATFCQFGTTTNLTGYATKMTQGSEVEVTWVINNTGSTLKYTDPNGEESSLDNDKFDVWVGTTKNVAGAPATSASKSLQNLYIGDCDAKKKFEFYLNDIKVTDLTPCLEPSITTQPSGASLPIGDANPELSVVASNTTSYAWKESSNGTSYDGSSSLGTSKDFTPSVNTAAQTKYYYCELVNSCNTSNVVKTNIVTVNVVASAVNVTGVSLDKTSQEFTLGATTTTTLTATVAPNDATNKAVSWESSAPTKVSVTDNGDGTAEIEALAEGTATITVSTQDGSFTATCDVTVHPDPCYAWGVGTSSKVVPATVGDLSLAWVGSSSTEAAFSGSSDKYPKTNSGSNYITGTLGGKVLEGLTIGASTSSTGSNVNMAIAFSSSATFSSSSLIEVSEGKTVHVFAVGKKSESDGSERYAITVPAGAKSFAIGRNFSFGSADGSYQNGDSRYLYYVYACPHICDGTAATKYAVSGTASICEGGNADVTLANSQSGAKYVLLKDAAEVDGSEKNGTGSALVWNVSETGTYTVKAIEYGDYCETEMTGSAVISEGAKATIATAAQTIYVGGATLTMELTETAEGAWESSAPAKATITNAGVVTAVAAGTTDITFTKTGGCPSAAVTITVAGPIVVSFDVAGGTAIDDMSYVGAPLTLPTAVNGTKQFMGWYEDNEFNTAVTLDGDGKYTPATSHTIYAKFLDKSDIKTLATLTLNGVTITGFEADKTSYEIELPYKTVTAPTVAATAADAPKASVGTITQATLVAGEGTASFTVTAEDESTQDYTIHFTVMEKEMLHLIGTKVTGNNAHGDVYGYGAGTAAVKVSSKDGEYTYKFNKGNYVGVTLADGLNFQAGDIVKIRVFDKQNATGFTLYTTNDQDSALIMDTRTNTVIENGIHELTLPNYAGSHSLYLLRQNNNYTGNMNLCVDSIAVYRAYPKPVLTAMTINGEAATIDNASATKTITAEVPYNTDFANLTLVETFMSNDPTQTTGLMTGAWIVADNEYQGSYVVTDKDGDTETYVVTLTKAPHYEAQIGETKYTYVAEAFAAVADGKTITLLDDCEYSAYWNLTVAGTVTLDLNGFDLTYTGSGRGVIVRDGAKLVLMDGTATVAPTIDLTADPMTRSAITYTSGTFDSKDGMCVVAGGEIEINSGRYLATEGVVFVMGENATATVNDGVLICRDNAVIIANGSNNAAYRGYVMNIHGGILFGEIVSSGYASMVVYHPNVGTLNIDGGILVSTNGPAVVTRGGESDITGGTIVAIGDGSGKCGDASLVLPAVGIAADFKSAYPGVASTDVAISGTVDVTGEAGAIQAVYASAEPTSEEVASVAVSGGTFNTVLTEAVCANGYVPSSQNPVTGKYGVTPKDPMCLIKAELSAPDDNTVATPTITVGYGNTEVGGNVKGAKTHETIVGYKFNADGAYLYVTLANGSFQAGDSVEVYMTYGAKALVVYPHYNSAALATSAASASAALGKNYVVLAEGADTLYLARNGNGWNPNVAYVAVFRSANPMLQKFEMAGAAGVINEANKTVAIEVPYATDVTALEPTLAYITNDNAQATVSPAGAQDFTSPVVYTITDKDGSATAYTVTVSIAEPSTDATLSALSYGGTAIALEDGVYAYTVNLAKGTTVVPALTATANSAVAQPLDITNAAAFENYEATSSVVVTAQNGTTTQTYTVLFKVAHTISDLVDVTENTTWDWSLVTKDANNVDITSSGVIVNESESGLIIASYLMGDNFDKIEGNNGAYAIRNGSDKKVYQGANLHFHSTVGGYLSIWAANEGHTMTLNVQNAGRDMNIAKLTGSQVEYKVYVQAGDVRIYNVSSDSKPMRVSKMIFTVDETPDYTRTVSNNIGTLCVDHNVVAGGALGATFYQIASRNELYDYKIDFEEVLPGEELKAGQPYIFKSNTGKIELFYGTTEADAPEAVRGMHGSFVDAHVDITSENMSDILYIAQNKLWNCEDLVGSYLEVIENRAYIVMSGVPTYAEYLEAQQNSNNAPRRRVTLGKDEAQVVTGFGELETSETPVKVLINGQIFIIRGEKMFDVTGKLVK